MKRISLYLTALLLACLAATATAQDDAWTPDGPVTIIVPWSAGGATDAMVRVVASEIEAALDQSVVVVNQPGASGAIGTKNALDAMSCTTWTSGAAADLGTYSVLDTLDTSLEDWHLYLTVANVGVVSVNANSPYETFDDLLAALQDDGSEISVATAGLSSAGHNAIELLAQNAGFDYRHVTYEGGNPAVISTVSGETDVTTQLAGEQADMIRGERLRPLAVIGDTALELDGYGSIPPVTDWLPDLEVATNYFGIWVPKGVDEACIERFDAIWEDEIANSEVLQRFASERGSLFAPMSGEEAFEAAFPMVQSNAWSLYDGDKAPVDPSTVGIPRPGSAD